MIDINPAQTAKKRRIESAVKTVGPLLIGFLVAPFIIKAIAGLVGLAVGAAICGLLVNFTPWFAAKLANWRLKALKNEAAKNPIETLENQYNDREAALVQFRENILSFHAVVQNFYSELEGYKERYPDKVQVYDEKYLKMKSLLNARGLKYKEAQRKLGEFSELIEQKRSEWKIAQAAAAMSKAAGVGEDFTSKLMADTAVDSVQTSLNTAFAELEVSLLDEKPGETPAITAASPQLALTEKAGPPVLDLDVELSPERMIHAK